MTGTGKDGSYLHYRAYYGQFMGHLRVKMFKGDFLLHFLRIAWNCKECHGMLTFLHDVITEILFKYLG